MKFKYYIVAVFSNIALLFYFLPWLYSANGAALEFYIIPLAWFTCAWVLLLVHVFFCIISKIENNANWVHHLVASIFIMLSYIGVFIGISQGFMVTV